MFTFKCKMCGGDIHAEPDATFGTCDHCEGTSTLPKANEERIVNLFNRADHFRRQSDFDKAVQAYENILSEDSTNAEAHWGVVLSRYGIEYVEDPTSGQRVPTCHRVQREHILSDADYLAALENASDSYTRELYETEGQKISEIQKGILEISSREEPYDVFICYKETDGGNRTIDSTLAQDIYHQLDNAGYRVFFARLTLEGKLGQQYEPYIFSAINSAKVMLVVGTKPEFFNAVWVKNEWSRYLALVKKDKSRLIIPCYRDMDAYDIPDELSMYQSQDMGKIGFVQDLIHGVKKVLDAGKAIVPSAVAAIAPTTGAAPGVESLMKRGWLFLEDGDWKQADEYFDKVLDIDPEHGMAYFGKLCAERRVTNEANFAKLTTIVENSANYKKAIRFADEKYREKLGEYNNNINARVKAENNRIAKENARIAEKKRKEEERIKAEKARAWEEEWREKERIKRAQENQKENQRLAELIQKVFMYLVGIPGAILGALWGADMWSTLGGIGGFFVGAFAGGLISLILSTIITKIRERNIPKEERSY